MKPDSLADWRLSYPGLRLVLGWMLGLLGAAFIVGIGYGPIRQIPIGLALLLSLVWIGAVLGVMEYLSRLTSQGVGRRTLVLIGLLSGALSLGTLVGLLRREAGAQGESVVFGLYLFFSLLRCALQYVG